ncbi:hypothetical protein BCR44DRAFT_41921 [Catenaria anguillulae PL171]|uniref:Ankyrin repeat-containing domain protein n=1 Tax=Catenaria anguillulae PL171 TaxID=765915 RepID=A0A1Y2HMN5_9FUNG|nr:hypothetical protein BCR44DRAFT_41921 [Catenaria anguillulae PL171]
MDFSSCIYLASTNGKLDVLDWLLNEAKAPLEAFLDAFNPADECKYYQVVLDCMAHQKTHDGSALLWWRHNVPQVQGTWMTPSPANEQYNPINMHLLEQVLKVQDILWPSAMWNLRGSWSMLSYLQNKGILTASGLAEEQDKDWSLEDELICISARTPPSWLCTALEWWQCAFPQQFACPAEIASGETPVREGARKWWLRSGLCAADSGITSFDRR